MKTRLAQLHCKASLIDDRDNSSLALWGIPVKNMWMRILAAALCALPVPVAASCDLGASPSYQDIRYIKVSQYSLLGPLYPSFQYEATLFPGTQDRKERVEASLTGKRAVKFIGSFVAVDPPRTFRDVIAEFERDHFFDLRLNPARVEYLDGPEDTITVVRCGVTTALGTISSGGEVELNDSRGRAFASLEDDLRRVIFSEGWMLSTPPPDLFNSSSKR